jgi:ABC-type transport system involved in cytochrome bd biosynthesis fused ATPase/permease subunit
MVDILTQLSELFAATAMILVLVVFFILNRKNNKLVEELALAKKQNKHLQDEQQKLYKQFVEFRTGSINLGQQVAEMTQLSQHFDDRLNELENTDVDSRLYSRANKLVQLGAGINELMEECELPKAEAELMMSLQTKIAAGKGSIPRLRLEDED